MRFVFIAALLLLGLACGSATITETPTASPSPESTPESTATPPFPGSTIILVWMSENDEAVRAAFVEALEDHLPGPVKGMADEIAMGVTPDDIDVAVGDDSAVVEISKEFTVSIPVLGDRTFRALMPFTIYYTENGIGDWNPGTFTFGEVE